MVQKSTCTAMFLSALFTIAKTWKQSKSPLVDKEDVLHIIKYDYSVIKRMK